MYRLFLKLFIYSLVLFIIHLALLPDVILAESVQKDTKLVHLVLPGESLHKIARQYLPLTEELTISDLVEKIRVLSGIQGSLIRPNQRLLILFSQG